MKFRLRAYELLELSAKARSPAMAQRLEGLARSFLAAACARDDNRLRGTTIILFDDFARSRRMTRE